MILLILFAFLAGLVTIFSPCILPILPIVFSSSFGGKNVDRSRPIGVIVGFVASFTFFTLFLTSLVKLIGIAPDSLRFVSVLVIAGFGLSLLFPNLQLLTERVFSKLVQVVPHGSVQGGFIGGIFVGLSLGLLWTPCVGPILASVISLAITGTVTFDAFVLTFAYSLGTAIPMFFIMIGGQGALQKVPWLTANTGRIQKFFGIGMILTAFAILTNLDRSFQTFILDKFPQYGVGLTKFEDIDIVKKQLELLSGKKTDNTLIGKPMFDSQSKGAPAPEIIPGGAWFGTKPLTIQSLKGKVVLIDFWTYTCINCQRTLPYLKKWWEKYKDKGLVILGIHTPEFEFEKDYNNVRAAVEKFGIKFPVVLDNDYSTWTAYRNQYWPRKYLIDIDGYIVYDHIGEGAYEETEQKIQEALMERMAVLKEQGIIDQSLTKEIPLEGGPKSPETYFGSARNNQQANLLFPHDSWNITPEFAENSSPNASIVYTYTAKDVFFVSEADDETVVEVLRDGKPLGAEAGADIIKTSDGKTFVNIKEARLYKIIQGAHTETHTIKLIIQKSGLKAFTFTFG